MRFISAEEVHSALGLPALADAIAEAFRAGTTAPLRHAHALSATDSLLLMPAWSVNQRGALGIKLVTVLPTIGPANVAFRNDEVDRSKRRAGVWHQQQDRNTNGSISKYAVPQPRANASPPASVTPIARKPARLRPDR